MADVPSYAISIYENPLLESVDISSLITASGGVGIYDNELLSEIIISDELQYTNINFSGNYLSQENVDDILYKIDTSGLESVGLSPSNSIDLSGGSSSVPSEQGLVYLSNLEEKGWEVYVNEA